ncbi:MAG TPA: sll0787 family AIR synthase-like protein [Polyangia bacterium]|nr:sll0787 family AIR synthase-like protein [Polyangia bacterium]
MLPELAAHLRAALGVQQKREIQAAARHLPRVPAGPWGATEVRLGDDCAAIPDGEGYLLLAAEGIWPELVAREPRFAGYCAVLVNVSDVYAMGGRPLAIVDALYATDAPSAEPLWAGMADAAARLGVPVVGGHTNLHSPYPALAAAVLGRARRLLTSFDARPGDDLIVAVDLRGQMHGRYPFWNASTDAPPDRLRGDYQVLPTLTEAGLLTAGKDISMGGVVGSALMLLEASGVGATLALDAVPRPPGVPWESWLLAFPSFGFVLAAPPDRSGQVLSAFAARGLDADVVGRFDDSRRLDLLAGGERAILWDLGADPLTGFGPSGRAT